MKYIIAIAAVLSFNFSFSQNCSKEALRVKPGTWKAGQQGSINNVTATDLAKEKATIESIHKMITTHYKPTGCEISYSKVFGKQPDPGQPWLADPYQYAMY